MLVTATVDLGHGSAELADEAPHLLAVAGWLLSYWLSQTNAAGPSDPGNRAAADASRRFTRWGVGSLLPAHRFAFQRRRAGTASRRGARGQLITSPTTHRVPTDPGGRRTRRGRVHRYDGVRG